MEQGVHKLKEQALHINGTTLYSLTNTHLNTFCVAVYARAGSIYETDENNGISHLLEHVIFRNINRKYNGRFYDLLAENGLQFSGSTYKEFLCFSIDGPSFGFAFACEALCSIFEPIALSTQELEEEKRRIKAEIREKGERYTLRYLHSKKVWQGTNGERRILGSCKILDRISRKTLENERRKIFSGDNCFFYVTGCATDSDMGMLRERIAALDINQQPLSRSNMIHGEGAFCERDSALTVRDGYACEICLGFDTSPQNYSGGIYDVIYQILFARDNALLFQQLSEKDPLLYSYDATYEQYDNAGCMVLAFEIPVDKLEEALSRVVEVLWDLKCGKFNLKANLNYELANWTRLLDAPEDLNWNLAYYNHILATTPVQYEKELFGRLADVTREKIMQAAQNIFARKNLTVCLEGPKRKIKTEHLNEILGRLDMKA